MLSSDESGADDFIGEVVMMSYPFENGRLALDAARLKVTRARPKERGKPDDDVARQLHRALCELLRLSTDEVTRLILDRPENIPLQATAVGGLIKAVYGDVDRFAIITLKDASLMGNVAFARKRGFVVEEALEAALADFHRRNPGVTIDNYKSSNGDLNTSKALYGDGKHFDAYHKVYYR